MINLKDGTLWQWSTGRKVIITPSKNCTVSDVHFFNGLEESARKGIIEECNDGTIVAKIPDALLQFSNNLTVYVVSVDKDGETTTESVTFTVNKRAKPDYYVFTDEEVITYKKYDDRLQYLEEHLTLDEDVKEIVETSVSVSLENELEKKFGNVPNVSTNDQTPTYIMAEEVTPLLSGEKLNIAFGKIAKAIKDYISHTTVKATSSVLGHVKVTTSSEVTADEGLVLSATEKNKNIEGTLAAQIEKVNSDLKEKLSLSGGKMSAGIDMAGNLIKNVADVHLSDKGSLSLFLTTLNSKIINHIEKINMSGSLGKVLFDRNSNDAESYNDVRFEISASEHYLFRIHDNTDRLVVYHYLNDSYTKVWDWKNINLSLSKLSSDKLSTSGGIMTGSLILSRTKDLSGTANNKPALIVGGTDSEAHMEFDANEIQAKSNGTSVGNLYIQPDGGDLTLGDGNNEFATNIRNSLYCESIRVQSSAYFDEEVNFSEKVTLNKGKWFIIPVEDEKTGGIYEVRALGMTNSNNIHMGDYNGGNLSSVYLHAKGNQFNFTSAYFGTNGNNTTTLGAPEKLWSTVYSKTGSINTSDRTKKHDINDISEVYEQLFMKLQPKSFMFDDGDRIHIGGISQDVEEAMNELGLVAEKFAGFCKDIRYEYTEYSEDDGMPIESSKCEVKDGEGNIVYDYALRYQEFIFLTIHMVQKTINDFNSFKEEVKKMQDDIETLKTIVNLQS